MQAMTDTIKAALAASPQEAQPVPEALSDAEIELDCLSAWNGSSYGLSAVDTVHPMFLSAFLKGWKACERAVIERLKGKA